jgi:hypothetical protein
MAHFDDFNAHCAGLALGVVDRLSEALNQFLAELVHHRSVSSVSLVMYANGSDKRTGWHETGCTTIRRPSRRRFAPPQDEVILLMILR